MLAAERRKIIMEKLYEDKRVIVGELSREFDVSEETIRRDLEHLSLESNVTKTYGGAVLDERSSIELPFNLRQKENPEGKQKIGDLVAEEINEGEHIFLDASTTGVFIAKSIKNKKNFTVITNSVENVIELADSEDIEVICTGGVLRQNSMSFRGSKALHSISLWNADKVFLSCKGLDLEKGVTDGNEDVAGIKNAMFHASLKRYLVVDSTKFNKVGFAKICDLKDIDVVITDKEPSQKWLKAFEDMGIRCIYG